MPLRLSIVMCTYNGAEYLQAQLDSLLAQTRLPDEIVISDDASTDATMMTLDAFAAIAGKHGVDVRISRHTGNVGFVENFSSALRQATGDVVFLCDQDDVWCPDKLAVMAARFAQDPDLLLLHSDARLVDAQGRSLNCSMFEALQMTAQEKQAIHDGRAFEVVMRRSFVTGATAAMRREVIGLALPIAADWIHDEWITAVVSAVGKMDFVDAPLIDYRQHGGNQIGARKRTLATKWQDLILPRGRFLADEATRLRRLETFFSQAGFFDGTARASQVAYKRAHFEHRMAIGRLPRYRRAIPILREAYAGDYRRYGTGIRSMLRDMLRHD
ncbi:glycosyltransferase involved in cell wall biosynthesis [Rhodanobacter sp. ANJX3]|uniref:glycosyltransferase family 2 protein n=1 Tax=Rhodanobacter sp. ANJX3 TaxID=2723083 RepID=UPI0017B405FD|nr:glycosyltransferase family 2 protein [Rhodanobacter sp. ANJX3]MBB5360709.1 glycosyltransferase involved in cell wall biosynthesis [Rhodanobacter sp. ANJX3]